MKPLLVILIFITSSLTLIAQPSSYECDSIYELAEQMPAYENGIPGLIRYVRSDLMPILLECNKRDGALTSSIYLTLTINNQGKVIAVEFQGTQASDQCKKELQEKLLTMTAWTAGLQDGIAVCSKFSWPISCMHWR